jgi:hypothetical protein
MTIISIILNTFVLVWLSTKAIKLAGKVVKKCKELKRRKYTASYYTLDDKDLRANMNQEYVY